MSLRSIRHPYLLVLYFLILGITITLSSIEPVSKEVPFYLDRQIFNSKPTRGNTAVPPADALYIASDLSGTWRHIGRHDGSRITLTVTQPGTYRVHFHTSGYTAGRFGDEWTSERSATYQNGVLLLNHPVEEYRNGTYNRMFTIKTSQGIRLISDGEYFYPRSSRDYLWFPSISFEKQ